MSACPIRADLLDSVGKLITRKYINKRQHMLKEGVYALSL